MTDVGDDPHPVVPRRGGQDLGGVLTVRLPQVAGNDQWNGEQRHGSEQGASDDLVAREAGLFFAALVISGRLGFLAVDDSMLWRSWTTSTSGISFLAHWIAPAPMKKMAPPKVSPRTRLLAHLTENRHVHDGGDVDGDVRDDEHDNRIIDRANMLATCRSARRAALGSVSVTRGLCSCRATGR